MIDTPKIPPKIHGLVCLAHQVIYIENAKPFL